MRKFVYTVSDLVEGSLECTELLYKSLLVNNSVNDFDFYILTNNKNFESHNYSGWNIIYEDCSSLYVGWLKYSKKILKSYDVYYYFDSDILCYESLSNLVDDSDLSLVIQFNKMSELWFCYPLADNLDKKNFATTDSFNAGTFVFKDLSFLDEIRYLCDRFDFSNNCSVNHAIFEQSSFNYNLFKKNIHSRKFKNLRDLIDLYPSKYPSEKKIYHFCGFDNQGMYKKSIRMKHFDIKYREKIFKDLLDKINI